MTEATQRQFDRYLGGELSEDEERELVRASLADQELFELLAASVIVEHGLRPLRETNRDIDPAGRDRAVLRFVGSGWSRLTIAAAGLAAAAAVVFAVYHQSPPKHSDAPPLASAPMAGPTPSVPGSIASRPLPPPTILTALLTERDSRSTVENRGFASGDRLPKAAGVVSAVHADDVVVDLGLLDGLDTGAVVRVYRGATEGKPLGTISITQVYRDRAVGVTTVPLSIGDRVVPTAAAQLAALVDKIAALIASDQSKDARSLAERAVSIARANRVPAKDAGRALAQLGTLEHRAGDLSNAERQLTAAVAMFDVAPAPTTAEEAETLNELGAVLIAQHKYADAETTLRRAQALATGATSVHVTNNLAALAAYRGDVNAARTLYKAALETAGSAPTLRSDRLAIAKNLADLGDRR